MHGDILVIRDHPASYGTLLPALAQDFPGHRVRLAEAAEIHGGALDDRAVRLLVMPGITGEDSPYPSLIREDGLLRIGAFAKRGVVLTICAATYFVCRETSYTPPWASKTRTSVNYLFNAAARGPVAPYARQVKDDPKYGDVVVVPIRFRDADGAWRDGGVCYGNGPALYPDPGEYNKAETLAVFAAVAGTPPALMRKATGRGAVYMSCVLPEIGYHPVPLCPGLEDARRVMQALQPHEESRRALWQSLVGRIKRDMRAHPA